MRREKRAPHSRPLSIQYLLYNGFFLFFWHFLSLQVSYIIKNKFIGQQLKRKLHMHILEFFLNFLKF